LATALVAGAATGAVAAHPRAAGADPAVRSAAPAAVVVTTITKKSITFSSGSQVPAGRTIFNVVAKIKHGDHTFQIVQLHSGYTKAQFEQDVQAGVQANKPDLQAVARLDHRVTWLGGATSRHGSTRQFGVALSPGTYYGFDQSGPAITKFTVAGPTPRRAPFSRDATATGTGEDTWVMPKVLPADGWIKLRDTSTEPHFFAITAVKKSTTNKQVRAYTKNPQGSPPWALKAHTDSGVFSRHTNVALHVQLPKGKYLVACFWPSIDNGMPHFFMGMWKLVHLR
jgi:hypothetical protein